MWCLHGAIGEFVTNNAPLKPTPFGCSAWVGADPRGALEVPQKGLYDFHSGAREHGHQADQGQADQRGWIVTVDTLD